MGWHIYVSPAINLRKVLPVCVRRLRTKPHSIGWLYEPKTIQYNCPDKHANLEKLRFEICERSEIKVVKAGAAANALERTRSTASLFLSTQGLALVNCFRLNFSGPLFGKVLISIGLSAVDRTCML